MGVLVSGDTEKKEEVIKAVENEKILLDFFLQSPPNLGHSIQDLFMSVYMLRLWGLPVNRNTCTLIMPRKKK